MRIKLYPFCFVACLLFVSKTFSQSGTYGNNVLTERPNTPINEMINGYIEVVPVSYASNPTKNYPLIVFLEGRSQFGDGGPVELQRLYGSNEGMLPDIVRKGMFPNSYTVGGTVYEFILIIPQVRRQVQTDRDPEDQMASPAEVNDVINYAMQHYRVDANRVYLSGLSLGGGSTWNYAGQSVANASRLAAIVPFAGASDLDDNPLRDDNIAAALLPVWTFVAQTDEPYITLAQEYINAINAHPVHGEALITIYNTPGDHNSWGVPLSGGNTQPPSGQPNNLYLWLLGKTRSLSQPIFASVNAGPDQTLNLPNGSMVLTATAINFTEALSLSGTVAPGVGGRPIVSTQWVRINGTGGTITSPGSLNTTVTNLKPGSYTFQLRATDDQGLITIDNVNVLVVKPPENRYTKVEAESFSDRSPGGDGASPTIEDTYLDEGPATGLGYLGVGYWVEYPLTLSSNGTYALYFRYIVRSGSPRIDVLSNGTTYSKQLPSAPPDVWRSDSMRLLLNANTTIRMTFQGGDWNFNYFELVLLESGSPLPVRFVYFNTQCKNSVVNLQWKTGQEQNSGRFAIQRSGDGVNWSEIGSVTAAGQSSQERSYAFVDKAPLASGNMYRVVEYGQSGQSTISSIVRSNCSQASQVSLYPNPGRGNSALNFTLQQASVVRVQVVDAKGAVLQQKRLELPSGNNSIPLNMTSYPDGVYSIHVQYGSEARTIKMIKR